MDLCESQSARGCLPLSTLPRGTRSLVCRWMAHPSLWVNCLFPTLPGELRAEEAEGRASGLEAWPPLPGPCWLQPGLGAWFSAQEPAGSPLRSGTWETCPCWAGAGWDIHPLPHPEGFPLTRPVLLNVYSEHSPCRASDPETHFTAKREGWVPWNESRPQKQLT